MPSDTSLLPIYRVVPLENLGPETAEPVGGKARNLARLTRAGLPVPRGYSICWPCLHPPHPTEAAQIPGFRETIARAWTTLGRPPVAVRSSGEAEDGVLASMAGQFTTLLGLRAIDAILSALTRCLTSASSLRVAAYERDLGAPKALKLGIVVQEMIKAEFAGVLFTANPRTGSRDEWVIEAARGSCEEVVAGKVQPTQLVLPRPSVAGGTGGAGPDPELSSRFPLPFPLITRLITLAAKVEALFGTPQDIEWCAAQDGLWLLQSRPITALATAAERAAALAAGVAELRARSAGRTVAWNRFTLSDTLAEPLPLSWAVARRFMAPTGAYGRAFRAFGFEFSPTLGEEGIAELVLGRTYINLDREARTYFGALPTILDVEALRRDPRATAPPTPRLDVRGFSAAAWLAVPGVFLRGLGMAGKERALFAGHAAFLRTVWLPQVAERARAEAGIDLRGMAPPALARQIVFAIDRFTRETLEPAFIATMLAVRAYRVVEERLVKALGPEEGRHWVRKLHQALPGTELADPAYQLGEVAARRLTLAAFLERFGHRAVGEMELARPRWSEVPGYVETQIAMMAGREPALRRAALVAERTALEQELEAATATRGAGGKLGALPAAARRALGPALRRSQEYQPLRELPKQHYLMEYANLRSALLALDEKMGLDGGVFYLLPAELGPVAEGLEVRGEIAARRRRRRVERSIPLPDVIWSDELERLGSPPDPGQFTLTGMPVSGGVVEGTVRIVLDPNEAPILSEDDILVAPSTDPGWTPLFTQVRGVVLECGGLLSHGAVVARELGLPAISNLPHATQLLRDGDRIRLDANRGMIEILPGS